MPAGILYTYYLDRGILRVYNENIIKSERTDFMETVKLTLNESRGVTMTCYIQPVGGEFQGMEKRPAMVILPGGGYAYCSAREADPVAFPYLQAGYQAFILYYSLNEFAVWDTPLKDYEQAVRVITEHADEWHVDTERIAVIGFSAGGHLAACAATMANPRPKAAILGYPVISSVKVWNDRKAPDPAESVSKDTCPCFVFASRNDGTVPIRDSLNFLSALERENIPFETHIYSYANHGFSTCEPQLNNRDWCCNRTADWVQDSIEWLRETVGDFTDGVLGPKTRW